MGDGRWLGVGGGGVGFQHCKIYDIGLAALTMGDLVHIPGRIL